MHNRFSPVGAAAQGADRGALRRLRRRPSSRAPAACSAASLPLFEWAARQHRQRTEGARIVLRTDLRDAEGEPRACLAIPGRLPLAFPSISAALAALARMEAAHAGR